MLFEVETFDRYLAKKKKNMYSPHAQFVDYAIVLSIAYSLLLPNLL